MSFIQLHLLISYPPSNPNRDDTGRPKTAKFGNQERLRISSQSLKRAWRTSKIFESKLKDHIGIRTRKMGSEILSQLKAKGVEEKKAIEWAGRIAKEFGKQDSGSGIEIQQVAHFSPEERATINDLVERLASGQGVDDKEFERVVQSKHTGADIALFGRMLASKPECNTEAAAQVAHAITVHRVVVENDFFTAVDDLNKSEDTGSAHMGDAFFGAGLFYLYLCINSNLLLENLKGNKELAKTTLAALIEAATTVAPSGKQNSFGSNVRASYVLAELGSQQPRSLSVAFLKPLSGDDLLVGAIEKLNETAETMDAVYGSCRDGAPYVMDAVTGKGSLLNLIDFASKVYA